MSNLKYRICSVSSEDGQYPAKNLLQTSLGWLSAPSPTYPQQITIQFYVPIRTKVIRMLFHQYKIPKMVEIFVKLGLKEKYRKLGFVLPSDNTQSNYEHKQLKSLFFEFALTHMKLILHQNYENEMNIFSQVGLQDLTVQGDILGPNQLTGVDLTEYESTDEEEISEIEGQNHKIKTEQSASGMTEDDERSSSFFTEIYRKLLNDKRQAVERQDFQAAGHIKNVLDGFKEHEEQLKKIQNQLKLALKREDYDSCHRLKQQMDRKRQLVQFQKEGLLTNEAHFFSQNSYSRVTDNGRMNENGSDKSTQQEHIFDTKRKNQPQQTQRNQLRQSQIFNSPNDFRKKDKYETHDSQVVPALKNKMMGIVQQPYEDLPLQTNEKNKSNNSYLYGRNNIASPDINQSIIPQINNQNQYASLRKDLKEMRVLEDVPQKYETNENSQKNQNKSQQIMQQQSEIFKLQPLQIKDRSRLQNYFDFIPQKIWKCTFSKNWKAKVEAIEFCKQKFMKDQVQIKQHYMAIFELLSKVISSKNPTNIIQSLHLFKMLVQTKITFNLQHLPAFVQDFIQQLLSMLNDTNGKIKQLSYTSYLDLGEISFLPIAVPVKELMRYKSTLKNPKAIQIKINLMTTFIERYQAQSQHLCKDIVNWCVSFNEDPSQKVKGAANNLILMLAIQFSGDKVIRFLSEHSHQVLQNFMNLLNSSVEHSKLNFNEQNSMAEISSRRNKSIIQSQRQNSFSKDKMKNNSNVQRNVSGNQRKSEESSRFSNKLKESENVDLSYSRQSLFQGTQKSFQNLQFQQSKSKQPERELENNIKVMEVEQQALCDFCFQDVGNDLRNHLLKQCKMLTLCENDKVKIYIREYTKHLLEDCEMKSYYRKCPKCGLAFPLDEINQHIARSMCRQQRGYNWERCQFCSGDVLADDQEWIVHAQKCVNLPPIKYEDSPNQSKKRLYDD